ncbi:MAG: type I restriction enzyme M protein [Marinomonas primoryensis]|jgi:type I restriction enzyme M protein
MKQEQLNQLGKTLWDIADSLRGAMNADDFRDYMLSFLFLRYLSDNYETAAQKELGRDYPKLADEDKRAPLTVFYQDLEDEDKAFFEKQMRRKLHYVIEPSHLWTSIAEMARTQDGDLLQTLEVGFKYIENQSFDSSFQGLFSEINLNSDKLGKKTS